MMTDNRSPDIDINTIPSPSFVLEESLLRKNLSLLQKVAREAEIEILVAFKGFAMWSTFDILKKYLDGATASSLNEAILCYEEFGMKAHLCAPVYLDQEIDKITNIASHITFNSLNQYELYRDIAQKKGLKIALRINPEYSEVGTALYNPCIPGSRLGITSAELGNQLPSGISGLHFHSLCEQNADALENTLKAVETKFGPHLKRIEWLNIGGGHHLTRQGYDIEHFISLIKRFKKKYGIRIIAEPGEAIAWQTGYLLSTVQDIVKANGYQTAMMDVSFSAHMPDCLEMPYKPKIWGALEVNEDLPTYRIGGNTCLAGDFLGDYSFKSPLKKGDKILFDDMIHYTMVKTTTFNGVNLPSIGIWKEDNTFEVIRTFGYEDFKTRLS